MSKEIIIGEETPVGLIGGMGGSIQGLERGLDPWHIEAFPDELKAQMEQVADVTRGERKGGWFALDYWGNTIGFYRDGSTVLVPDQAEGAQETAKVLSKKA